MQMRLRTKRMVLCAVFVALGVGLQIVESMVPLPVNLPGGKLGLANITTLILLYSFGGKTAFVCAVLRPFLGSLLYGGVSAMLYSVTGSLTALFVMLAVRHAGRGRFSPIGVSIAGAVSHNAAQTAVAAVLLSNVWIFTYLPILAIAACITGIFTGYAAKFALAYLKKARFWDGKEDTIS